MKRPPAVLLVVPLAAAVACAWILLARDPCARRGTICCGKAKADVVALHSALCEHRLRHGAWPRSLAPLVVPDEHGYTLLDRSTLPLDPWERPYRYDPPTGAEPRPRVYTLGADGRPGGTGEDEDVDSWRFLPPRSR